MVHPIRSALALTAAAAVGATVALVVAGGSGVETAAGSLPLTGSSEVSGNGADPAGTAYGTGSHWNVLNWGPGEVATTPLSFSYNYVDAAGQTQRRVLVDTGSNPDVGSAASSLNTSRSDDGGRTFLTTQRGQWVHMNNAVRLRDGSFLAPEFIPIWGDAAHTFVNIKVDRSADGITWQPAQLAPLANPDGHQFGPMSNGLRVAGRPIVLPDGTIIVAAYTAFANDAGKQSSLVLQTTDNGASWSVRSIIPASGERLGINEAGISYTTDGRLVAVMRTVMAALPDGTGPSPLLVTSFSDDDGRTWSDSTPLLGPDGKQIGGVQPDLLLQPNGTLLLTTGRPDVRVYVNYDGTGRRWDVSDTVFANYPSSGNNGRWDGSSGNNSLVPATPNRSVLFYDQCAPWGCGAYDQQAGASAEFVGALTPGTGLIDLASLITAGSVTLTGDFPQALNGFPEMRPSGAFDGSTDFGAEARIQAAKGVSPSMVIALDRRYTLDRVGLMLGHGEQQSATVELSVDGKHWDRPVVRQRNSSDYAMRYSTFAPTPARYVRVVGAKNVTTTVTELQLYSADVDGFENELPFAVPRGWTDAEHAWVTDVRPDPAYSDFGGYRSKTALRLWDKYTDSNAHITRPVAPTGHLKATMQWGTSDTRASFTAAVTGKDRQGTAMTAWQFEIVNGAAGKPQDIKAFDGTAWQTIGTLSKPIVTRAYLPLTIDAKGKQATISIGTDTFTTSVSQATATTFDGITFSTGTPSAYGGIYYLDDVVING